MTNGFCARQSNWHMTTSRVAAALFGAVIVKAGEIIATGINEIMATNDPTAHAELMAIRMASQKLGHLL